MVIGTIKCSEVCERDLQAKRPINNNLKWPQDHESPGRRRNTSHQGLWRKTFSLSQPVTKPRVTLLGLQALFAAFSSIYLLTLFYAQKSFLGVERGRRGEGNRKESRRGSPSLGEAPSKHLLCTKHFAECSALSSLRLSTTLPAYRRGSHSRELRSA